MCHWYIDISAKNQFVRKSVFARLRIDGSGNSPQIVFSHSAPDRNKLFRDKTNLGITLAKYHLETFLQMRRRKVFQNFPHCCSKLSVPTETETFGEVSHRHWKSLLHIFSQRHWRSSVKLIVPTVRIKKLEIFAHITCSYVYIFYFLQIDRTIK